ncbi:MAG: multidrug transporter AcrB [Gammaproteobacteria bacterium]|nr:multidrug transporter AcrB [Gammaproteobacteria bacterium]|tara:strand:+ start:1389 stop:4538 length:3150 start_codon:yes stop_codon:yes gene_type:complete
MIISDTAVRRPVFAAVISLLLIAFGLISFDRLPLREYPDIDPPIVGIETIYRGAAASVVETRITEVIEERIAGVEGIEFIESSSQDGRSDITVEFSVGRDVDAAANDIRDRVSSVLSTLPDEAEPPEVRKVDSNESVIMWINLTSDRMTVPELTDYAERYLVDRFSVLDGVARVFVGGAQRYAMRIWLDRQELAARSLTVSDVENALRAGNVELPAGEVESIERQFTVRVQREFENADDFRRLVIAEGADGYLVRLGDVARVEKGTEEDRTFFRGNGIPQVGLGVVRQSTANLLDVARAAKRQMEVLTPSLPEGMSFEQSYDSSIFVEGAVNEVYKTLFIAVGLVVLTIFLFLGSVRAMLVPAVTVPVCIIATFIALYALGFSVNLLTLLALVLAIGLVVDDAIVMLENIHRRIDHYGETPLVAAYRGARQVGFAIVATTAVLVAVFVPIAFLEGDIGRLFSEFALSMAAAVVFSSIVALTLAPALASKVLRSSEGENRLTRMIDHNFTVVNGIYRRMLTFVLRHWIIAVVTFLAILASSVLLIRVIPSEYTPDEDRGSFFTFVRGPEGATYEYMKPYMDEIERRLMPYVESGEVQRLLVRTPGGFGGVPRFNSGAVIIVLSPFDQRRSGFVIVDEVRQLLSDLPGVMAFPVMRQGFGSNADKPLQFVIGGGTYEELAEWRDILLAQIDQDNPGLLGLDWDYKETQPQLKVHIDYNRSADLGVSIADIGRTLETLLGSRRVTTYIDNGEEYEVILEGERDTQRTPSSMENIYVRSSTTGELIPLSNLVRLEEFADSNSLNRYNRVRAITLEANLAPELTLGEAVTYLEGLVRDHLPEGVVVDYKGQTRDLQQSSASVMFVMLLGIAVVFLALAAQFESFRHPLTIMLTVPIAIAGGLLGLWATGNTVNIYSQIGLVMLVGLAAKNGILIVEFANQLRDEGVEFMEALVTACEVRLRPIVMTTITTAAGTLPLILGSGPGAETRQVIGIVVFSGVTVATFFTLFIVPVAYRLISGGGTSPLENSRRLERELEVHPAPRSGSAEPTPTSAG